MAQRNQQSMFSQGGGSRSGVPRPPRRPGAAGKRQDGERLIGAAVVIGIFGVLLAQRALVALLGISEPLAALIVVPTIMMIVGFMIVAWRSFNNFTRALATVPVFIHTILVMVGIDAISPAITVSEETVFSPAIILVAMTSLLIVLAPEIFWTEAASVRAARDAAEMREKAALKQLLDANDDEDDV